MFLKYDDHSFEYFIFNFYTCIFSFPFCRDYWLIWYFYYYCYFNYYYKIKIYIFLKPSKAWKAENSPFYSCFPSKTNILAWIMLNHLESTTNIPHSTFSFSRMCFLNIKRSLIPNHASVDQFTSLFNSCNYLYILIIFNLWKILINFFFKIYLKN